MMNGWDELVGRLTHRLRVDEELRLDVARELRAHLEDSAAELRRAGQDQQEAADSAAAALGDEGQLAEMLWTANRRRIRLRGVLRWAARVTLLPAAVLVIVFLAVSMSGKGYPMHMDQLFGPGWPARRMALLGGSNWLDDLTEEERFILTGDPAAKDGIERAKSIADRWPDNPVYYGDYIVKYMHDQQLHKYMSSHRFDSSRAFLVPEVPEPIESLFPAMDKGERIDPDNAFYDFFKASWLIQAAGTLSEDPNRYETVDRDGEVHVRHYDKIEIQDPEHFRRGLQEFRQGLAKAECTSRTLEMIDLRLSLLPEPEKLSEYLRRLGLQYFVLLPRLNDYRVLARSLCAYAIQLAAEGEAEEAIKLVDSVKFMAAKLGAKNQTFVQLLVANAIHTLALTYQEEVYKELGQPEQVEQAHQARLDERVFFENLQTRSRQDELQFVHAGLIATALSPRLSGYEIDFEPARSAEQYVWTQVALMDLLALLVLLALLLGAAVLVNLIFRRGENRPILVFVGWRRIGGICLWAILVPIATYAIYAYILTAGDRAYGLNYTGGKTILEYMVTIGAIFALLLGLSYSAIRRRAEEIGLAVPPPIRLRDRRVFAGLGAVVALAVAVYLVGWTLGPFKPGAVPNSWFGSTPGALLAGLVALFLVLWGLREWVGGLYHRGKYARFRRSLSRSAVPILASAVIIVGLFCGWALGRAEVSAVRRMTAAKMLDIHNEVERSDYRLLRDRFEKRHEEMLAEFLGSAKP